MAPGLWSAGSLVGFPRVGGGPLVEFLPNRRFGLWGGLATPQNEDSTHHLHLEVS